jgi:hypothetical protein
MLDFGTSSNKQNIKNTFDDKRNSIYGWKNI